jgi:hypothetical protein
MAFVDTDIPEAPLAPPPNGDPLKDMYNILSSPDNKYYTKSFDEFKKKYSSKDEVDKLFDFVSGEQLYTKSKDDFYGKYFPSLTDKKKEDFPLLYPRSKPSSIQSTLGGRLQGEESKPVGVNTKEEVAQFQFPKTSQLPENFSSKDIQKEAERQIAEQGSRISPTETDPLGAIMKGGQTNEADIVGQQTSPYKYQNKGAETVVEQKKQDILNGAFPSADQAKSYLTSVGITNIDTRNVGELLQQAGNNLTKQVAIGKYENFKNVEKAFDYGKRTLGEAAAHWAADHGNEDVKYLIDNRHPINDATMGDLKMQFLQTPELFELADKNPALKQEINEEISNFPATHPETAAKILGDMLADEREQLGQNSSWSNIVSKESGDKLMKGLIDSGKIPMSYMSVYQNEIRPKLGTINGIGRLIGNAIPVVNKAVNEDPITTPGALQGLVRGAENVETDLAKGIVNLTGLNPLSKEQNIQVLLHQQAAKSQFEPTSSLHQLTMHGSEMLPFVASVFLGGNLLRAANIVKSPELASALSMVINSHGQQVDKALMLFPDNDFKQYTYIGTMDLANGFLGRLLPGQKLFGAAEDSEVAGILSSMVDGKISTDAAKNQIINFFKTTIKGAAKGALGGAEYSGAMSGLDDALTRLLQNKGVDLSQTFSKTWEGAKLGLLSTIPAAGLEGMSEGAKGVAQNKGIRNEYINFAHYADYYKGLIADHAKSDPEFAKLAPDILSNLEHLSQTYTDISDKGMGEDRLGRYLANSLSEKIANDKLKVTTDPRVKQEIKDKIEKLDEDQNKILGEKEAVAVTTPRKTGREVTKNGVTVTMPAPPERKSTAVIMPHENVVPENVPLKKEPSAEEPTPKEVGAVSDEKTKFLEENPHSGGALTGNPDKFDKLPDDSEVWVFTATTPNNAKNIIEGGEEYVPELQGQNIKGESKNVYVGSDPRVVSGLGKTIVAFKVKKSDLGLSPEAEKANQSLGRAVVSSATGAILKGKPIESHIVENQSKYHESSKEAFDVLAPYLTEKPPTVSEPSAEEFTANGGNKIVDKNGQPVTLLHGTNNDNIKFDKGTVFYATDDKQFADVYGEKHFPVQIVLKNPYDLTNSEDGIIKDEQGNPMLDKEGHPYSINYIDQNVVNDLKSRGYDGVRMGNQSVVAFDKSQIREPSESKKQPSETPQELTEPTNKLEAEKQQKIDEAMKPELPEIKEISDKDLVKAKDRGNVMIRHDEITDKLDKLKKIIDCVWAA